MMTPAEARQTLLRHAVGAPAETPTTLLESLRPYRGVQVEHLLEILHALVVVAPGLHGGDAVDREVVHSLWELCRTARAWTRGPHEPEFHGLRFIPPDEKATLDRWIGEIEHATLLLLRGEEEWLAFLGIPWLLTPHRLAARATFLAPLFEEALRQTHEDEADSGVCDPDDGELLCQSLAEMGAAAASALPLLRRVHSDTRFPTVRAAASEAIEALERFEGPRKA